VKGEKEQPKFPNIYVSLKDQEDTAFRLLVRARTALRDAGIVKAEQDRFLEEATAQDFDHLVQTVKRWVETTQTDEVEI